MSILQGECAGSEIACNDDFDMEGGSVLTLNLPKEQWVTIVVGGFMGAEGTATLSVNQDAVPCPDDSWELEEVPFQVEGDTAGGHDRYTAILCFADFDSPDAAIPFTAPTSGSYVFDTYGSELDTVLAAYQGICGNQLLSCSDDTWNTQSQIVLQLEEGQAITLVVDGFSGTSGRFVLNGMRYDRGDCCEVDPNRTGCSSERISDCVCAELPDCCDVSWSGACVQAVNSLNCGDC